MPRGGRCSASSRELQAYREHYRARHCHIADSVAADAANLRPHTRVVRRSFAQRNPHVRRQHRIRREKSTPALDSETRETPSSRARIVLRCSTTPHSSTDLRVDAGCARVPKSRPRTPSAAVHNTAARSSRAHPRARVVAERRSRHTSRTARSVRKHCESAPLSCLPPAPCGSLFASTERNSSARRHCCITLRRNAPWAQILCF